MYFSTCGKFLYSANWDIFANVQDLLDPTSIPDGSKVLESFKSELEEKRVWKEVPQNHPEVLFEDVLYASGQNRFKIFRVRTYLVLGWSADGNNLYYPQPQNDELAYTWYRRILCAIPRSREMWKATLIWPGPYRSLDHLSVVLFPAPDSVEYQLPRIIFTPLTAINLLAEEGNKDANGDDTDGWFRGHAFGCPYHFKS